MQEHLLPYTGGIGVSQKPRSGRNMESTNHRGAGEQSGTSTELYKMRVELSRQSFNLPVFRTENACLGWSDNSLLLLTAQGRTSKAAGQWPRLHQRLQGLSGCRKWEGSTVFYRQISRALLLVSPGLRSSPISRAHSLLSCLQRWLMTIISQGSHTPELYTKEVRGKGQGESLSLFCRQHW